MTSFHGGTVGVVRRVIQSSTTGELSNKVIVGPNDGSSRVITSRERTRIIVVWVHCCLNRVEVVKEAVTALVGLETIETTNSSKCFGAALNNKSGRITVGIWLLDFGSSKNGFE